MNKKRQLKTPAEARAEFRQVGKSVCSWARDNGVQRDSVYAVLSGRNKGERGEAHKVAVLLGIKDGVVVESGNRSAASFFPVEAKEERQA